MSRYNLKMNKELNFLLLRFLSRVKSSCFNFIVYNAGGQYHRHLVTIAKTNYITEKSNNKRSSINQ
jgi:hypothetical protein